MSIRGIQAGMAYVKINADSRGLDKSLKSIEGKMQSFGSSLARIGAPLAGFGAALAIPFTHAIRGFAKFDEKMRLVAAVSGAAGNAFEKLTQQAKELGRTTSYTATQVAEGMVSLGRMGFSTDEIEKSIQAILNLDKSTGMENLGQSAQIAGNALRVFQMQASEMPYVVDILSMTANKSAQTLEDLGEAFKMAGPFAARAGADIKETAANLGILANMGIRGSLAGTALGKSYKRMADPKVRDFLKGYGIETVDANGNLLDMRKILGEVARAMSTMGSAARISFAEEIFDARGSLGGGTLSINTTAIDELNAALDKASGYADKVAKSMDAGLQGAFYRLMSAVEGAENAFASAINNSLIPFVEWIARNVTEMSEWIEKNAGLVTELTKLVATASAVGAVLLGTGLTIKATGAGIGVLRDTLKSVASPFMKAAQAAKAQSAANVTFIASGKAAVTVEQAKAAASVASTKAQLAQAQVTAAQTALANAKTASDRASAQATLTAANAELADAMATRDNATADMAAITAKNAYTASLAKMTTAQLASLAVEKRVAISQAQAAVASALRKKELATLTGIQVESAGASLSQAQANLAAANTDYQVAQAELAKSTAMKASTASAIAANKAMLGMIATMGAYIAVGAGVVAILKQVDKYQNRQTQGKVDQIMENPNRVARDNESRQSGRMNAITQDAQDLAMIRKAAAESMTGAISNVQEVQSALNRLSERGFTDLPGIDATTGKLEQLSEAAKQAAESVSSRLKLENLTLTIREKQRELAETQKVFAHLSALPKNDEATIKATEESVERMKTLQDEINNLTKERAGMKTQGAEAAAAGSETTNTRIAEIEKELKASTTSNLQKEIDRISELKKEYLDLLDARLKNERAKTGENREKAIADLEAKMSEAATVFDQRIQDAINAANKGKVFNFDKEEQQREIQAQFAIETSKQDYILESAKKEGNDVYKRTIEKMLSGLQMRADTYRESYNRAAGEATSEGSIGGVEITDAEEERLKNIQSFWDAIIERMYDLKERFAGVTSETQTGNASKIAGGFSTAAIAQQAQAANYARTTAQAVQSLVNQTAETNRTLQALLEKPGLTF